MVLRPDATDGMTAMITAIRTERVTRLVPLCQTTI